MSTRQPPPPVVEPDAVKAWRSDLSVAIRRFAMLRQEYQQGFWAQEIAPKLELGAAALTAQMTQTPPPPQQQPTG